MFENAQQLLVMSLDDFVLEAIYVLDENILHKPLMQGLIQNANLAPRLSIGYDKSSLLTTRSGQKISPRRDGRISDGSPAFAIPSRCLQAYDGFFRTRHAGWAVF
jgi:hypothetical protein